MDKEIEGINEIRQMFSKTMYRIYNGSCGGDDGMPKLGIYYDKALKKLVLEKPIERSNNTRDILIRLRK